MLLRERSRERGQCASSCFSFFDVGSNAWHPNYIQRDAERNEREADKRFPRSRDQGVDDEAGGAGDEEEPAGPQADARSDQDLVLTEAVSEHQPLSSR